MSENRLISWNTIPIILVIIVFIESILVLVVSQNVIPNLNEYSNLISGFLGLIVGTALTFFTSYYFLTLNRLQKLKSISRGFLSELSIYQENLRNFIKDHSKEISTSVNSDFLQEMNRPFFENNSLYYVLRREMFEFDEKIVNNLLQFYSLMMIAEEDRRRIIILRDDLTKNFQQLLETQIHLLETLQKANSLIPGLIVKLNEII